MSQIVLFFVVLFSGLFVHTPDNHTDYVKLSQDHWLQVDNVDSFYSIVLADNVDNTHEVKIYQMSFDETIVCNHEFSDQNRLERVTFDYACYIVTGDSFEFVEW